MKELFLSIDQGTTSSRAIIYDLSGTVYAVSQKEFKQHYPQDGWVEHDAEEIWADVVTLCGQALAELPDPAAVKAIGITNQRETVVIWNKQTGKPVAPAIVWQDRRTHEYCKTLKSAGYEDLIQKKTGLLLDPYFSASKINWLLKHLNLEEREDFQDLIFGTMESWLLWNLTGGTQHLTDVSNASRTMLMNLETLSWDEELLNLFEIPRHFLPKIVENTGDFGLTAKGILPVTLPITGMAGDQQSAMIGQACIKSGMLKATYGTGCFALLNIGATPVRSKQRLLTTVAWKVNGEVAYALEGAIFNAGTAIQWLRDEMKFIEQASETEKRALKVTHNHGVYFVPAFTGLGAPYWDPLARGAIFGLTRDTSQEHIIRAALEAICYQTRDLMEAMFADVDDTLLRNKILRVDGGMVKNNWVMQFLADVVGMKVDRPTNTETTAFGAVCLAALGAGVLPDLEALSNLWQRDKAFIAEEPRAKVDVLYQGWKANIRKLLS